MFKVWVRQEIGGGCGEYTEGWIDRYGELTSEPENATRFSLEHAIKAIASCEFEDITIDEARIERVEG